MLPVNGAVRVPIPKTKDRIQKRFNRTREAWMQNPNRVGGGRLPPQHHDQQNNSPHAEPDPHNNHKIREMEKEKRKKKKKKNRIKEATEGGNQRSAF